MDRVIGFVAGSWNGGTGVSLHRPPRPWRRAAFPRANFQKRSEWLASERKMRCGAKAGAEVSGTFNDESSTLRGHAPC